MKFDLIISNGLTVMETETGYMDIGICGEKIAAILPGDSGRNPRELADRVMDASGCYVMPGGVDTHTHFFEPGADYREDFYYGTMAAASGGFTTVMEMPNSNPAVTDPHSFLLKKGLAEKKAVVDFALWAGAVAGNEKEREQLKALGCAAFKGFTLDAGPSFPWLDTEGQMEAMSQISGMNRVLGFHAEDPAVVQGLRRRYSSQPWSLELHEKARPYYGELAAIQQIILFAKETGCPVHICHLSIPEGAELIRQAKAEGVDITAESCSHYFLLNTENASQFGTYGLIQPPLRNRERMERLWEYLFDGTIDYLGTDHAPYTEQDKEPEGGSGWDAPGGAPSIDTALPLMFDEAVLKRGMSPVQFARLSATNGAKRFSLYPRKGSIHIGADADLILIDPSVTWEIDRKRSFSKTKNTRFPYQGRIVNCGVAATLVRGKVVYDHGKIVVQPGYGKFQRPW